MNFFQQLDEAANIPIEHLKDVIRKDKRVSKVLQRNVDLADLDVPEFLSTIKFYLLNNKQIEAYVAQRGNRRRFSSYTFSSLRKLTPEKFDQDRLEELSQFVKDIFRDLTDVNTANLTSATHKEVFTAMAGTDRGYFNLGLAARLELKSLKLQPPSKVLVYRGLIFNDSDLTDKTYGGTLNIGNGLKLLRSVRQGTRIIDLEWDKATAWTTDLDAAKRYAQRRGAIFRQDDPVLDRTQGVLGIVVSMLADPKDVIVDLSLIHI